MLNPRKNNVGKLTIDVFMTLFAYFQNGRHKSCILTILVTKQFIWTSANIIYLAHIAFLKKQSFVHSIRDVCTF